MEPGLPVWTVRPNWRNGVLERLEWLTDVMAAQSSGVEQRRALRLSPRRYVEITVNPTRQERSFLDLLLHRDGSETWLFPLWFDVVKLNADAAETDTRVEFDNTFREHGEGQFALLFKNAFKWEVVSIDASDDDGLDLADPLEADWPAGTVIFPLRLARLPLQTALAAITGRVGESVLMFQFVQANDFVEVEPVDLVFEGAPVLLTPPNRSQEITLDHVRLAMERDNSTGIPYRTDPLDRAFQVQGHSWMIQGREAHAQFRSLLYWLRGRQRSLWLPSFNDDIITTSAADESDVNLDIEHIGYGYSGGGEVIDGRDVVLVNGTPGRITELGVAPSDEEERLRIGDGLTADIPAGSTGSFMTKSRLNQDAVEIMHHTDTDGVAEIAASFQSFADNRDASGVIDYPIPLAVMTAGLCGEDAPPSCFDIYMDFQEEIYTLNGDPVELSDLLVGSGEDNDFNNFLVEGVGISVTAEDLAAISQTTGFSVTPLVMSYITAGHGVYLQLEMYALGYEPSNPLDYGRVFFNWGTYGDYGTPNLLIGMGEFEVDEVSYTPDAAEVLAYTESGGDPNITAVSDSQGMISDFTFGVAANLTIDQANWALNGTGIHDVDPPSHLGTPGFTGAGLFLLMNNPDEGPVDPEDGFKVVIRKLRIVPPQGGNVLNMSTGSEPNECGEPGTSRKLTAILLHGQPSTDPGETGPQGGTMFVIGDPSVIEDNYPTLFAMAGTVNTGYIDGDFNDPSYFPDGVSVTDPINDFVAGLLDPGNFTPADPADVAYLYSNKYYMTTVHARWYAVSPNPGDDPVDWAAGCWASGAGEDCDGPTASEMIAGFPSAPDVDTLPYPWDTGEVGAITQAGGIFTEVGGDYTAGASATPPPTPSADLGNSSVNYPVIQTQSWITYIFTER